MVQCKKCDKKLKTEAALGAHMSYVHGKEGNGSVRNAREPRVNDLKNLLSPARALMRAAMAYRKKADQLERMAKKLS